MDIGEVKYGSAVVLHPNGRLDQDSADAFQSRLLETMDAAEAVIVDFSGVPYISSVGLRALMIAAKQGKSTGVSLGVADLTPTVKEVFEISRFNFVVDVFEVLGEALAAVSDEALAAYEST